jgi:hypothetical protein
MTNGTGFISPETEDGIEAQLRALTAQVIELPPITRGIYIFDEDDLSDEKKELLHGRAYVVDREQVTETDPNSPRTYYVAADQGQGLIVPARALSINAELDTVYYRFSDNGIAWTSWITLFSGVIDNYLAEELNRFAELQVYGASAFGLVSVRASR